MEFKPSYSKTPTDKTTKEIQAKISIKMQINRTVKWILKVNFNSDLTKRASQCHTIMLRILSDNKDRTSE